MWPSTVSPHVLSDLAYERLSAGRAKVHIRSFVMAWSSYCSLSSPSFRRGTSRMQEVKIYCGQFIAIIIIYTGVLSISEYDWTYADYLGDNLAI